MKKSLLSNILISSFLIGNLSAQSDFKKQQLSVFKNGTSFFIKSGTVTAPEGTFILTDPPVALFGTIWAGTENGKILALKSIHDKSSEKLEAKSIRELLLGNIGKRVKLVPFTGDSYEGEILSVSTDIVNLRTKEGWAASQLSSIKNAEFITEPTYKYESELEKNQLLFEFDSPGQKNIELMYLERGICWFPNYLITLKDDKNAEITLKALLINDAEDLISADVDFVVGVPNFKYNYLSSPLTSSQLLSDFISSLGSNSTGYSSARFDNYLSNNIMTQQSMPAYDVSVDFPVEDNQFSMAEGGAQEDLYFYKHSKVSLKKGERSTFTLLEVKLPFEHIYEVTLSQNSSGDKYYYSESGEDNTNKVWHSIKLKNVTKMPWTTGTAMVVKEENGNAKPVSQDMMKYTPVNSNGFLKITVSPDISVKDKDKETSRQEKAKKRNGSFYDQVSIEASIKTKNYKDKDIKLVIKRTVSGELIKSNIDWDTAKVLNNSVYGGINPVNEITWEVELKAGEEKEITYSYSMYVYN